MASSPRNRRARNVDRFEFDIVLVGGGIAGLWTANRLLRDGWNVAVVEADSLGAAQTLASQGILHSGVKYGIDGSNREIAQQLKALPPRWMSCLAGTGELDLTSVRLLASTQFLWSRDRVIGGFTAAMAGKAMQGEVRVVPESAWPEPLRADPPSGSLYEVQEGILDVQTVVHALARPLQGRAISGGVTGFSAGSPGGLRALTVRCANGQMIEVEASAFVFTAGTGNEAAAAALGFAPEITQRRPLRMVLVRGMAHPLFGHCVTTSPRPRATITSHADGEGWIWYLGGESAEHCEARTEAQTLDHARSEMESIFPSTPWKDTAWACLPVDRAEPRDPKGWLPPEPRLLTRGNTTLAWPTKLVYAPLLADRVIETVASLGIAPGGRLGSAANLPQARVGDLPWQKPLPWRRL